MEGEAVRERRCVSAQAQAVSESDEMENDSLLFINLHRKSGKSSMEAAQRRKTSRKLSADLHRKISAISTCSDVSNISVKLGLDPGDFKSTLKNILGQLGMP